jgi:hypothetical protein
MPRRRNDMHHIAHRAAPAARLTSIAVAVMVAACSVDNAPSAPSTSELAATRSAELDVTPFTRARHEEQVQRLAATLRRVTARYHHIEVAKRDSFVLLHDCETRLNDEPVGTVYVNLSRLTDGVINPEKPDALIYEPSEKGLKLVGVEFAIPFTLWTQPNPPQLLGTTFQREDEFGVFALHAWVWRRNPNGMFAETNPRVTCSGA